MNILVSSCLLGVHCRYDGVCQELKEFDEKLPLLMEKFNIIPVCPEVYGGLTIPREPAEIKDGRVVIPDGSDVTEAFVKGAKEVLHLAKLFDCKYAILKERSPSCGSNVIYDGTFSHIRIPGDGVTTALLKKNGIQVFGESEIDKLLEME
jgi:uncharacterized protein YbbK (DUF523 family)